MPPSSKLRVAAALAALLLLYAHAADVAVAGEPGPPGYRTTAVSSVVRGVVSFGAFQPGRLAVRVARIEPDAAVHVTSTAAHDRMTSREPTSSVCRRTSCLLAVNGDFFDVESSQPFGGMVTDGLLVRTPVRGRDQLNITTDGRWSAGILDWGGRLVPVRPHEEPPPPRDGPLADLYAGGPNGLVGPRSTPSPSPAPEPDSASQPITLAGVNVPPARDSVVAYSRHWHDSTLAGADLTELVVQLAEPLRARQVQPVVPVELREGTGNAPIPPDGAVFAGHGAGADELRQVWRDMQAGELEEVLFESAVSIPGLATSLGGGPVILRDGLYVGGDSDLATGRHPRTLVGWSDNGRRWMVTVDGRQPRHSQGMTLREAAELMQQLGATHAFNLDGGGSTTFVELGRVTNRPVHAGRPGHERPVANAFLAIATESMITPPPAPPPPAPAADPPAPPPPPPPPPPTPPPPTPEPTPAPTPTPTARAPEPIGGVFSAPQESVGDPVPVEHLAVLIWFVTLLGACASARLVWRRRDL